MLETGNYGNSAKQERGGHSGKVIFSGVDTVEFEYGVECIELPVDNCGLLSRYFIKQNIPPYSV